MIHKFFDKTSGLLADESASSSVGKSEIMVIQESAEKLHQLVIRKYEKSKV